MRQSRPVRAGRRPFGTRLGWVGLFAPAALAALLAWAAPAEARAEVVSVRDIQSWLAALGYAPGQPDGFLGARTRQALQAFYADRHQIFDGQLDGSEVADLRAAMIVARGVAPAAGSVADKLSRRTTVNVFKAWNTRKGIQKYALTWANAPETTAHTISLSEIYWAYAYDGAIYPGEEKFLSDVNWEHPGQSRPSVATRITDPAFPAYIARIAQSRNQANHSDGIMLDWWHDQHPSGYDALQVRAARIAIATHLRQALGPDAIILGNVNWEKETATVSQLNGVFLELHKNPPGRLYTAAELATIESRLSYYDAALRAPGLIALEGWRATRDLSNADRNSAPNRRMAKLLTAMSIVIPRNGYILYADNNPDSPNGDHDHDYYNFYDFDAGHPTSGRITVRPGVGYKEHEHGFVAYNITDTPQTFTRKSGRKVTIAPQSGLFCHDQGERMDCLRED